MNQNYDTEYPEQLAAILWNMYANIFKRSHDEFRNGRVVSLRLNINKKAEFCMNFNSRYKYVIEHYMEPSVVTLDRHKTAAIAIIEFILTDVIDCEEPEHDENEIFMLKYYLAAQTGLAYMQYWFNSLLEVKGITTIKEWVWPQMLSCPDNKYFCAFARNLYYTEKQNGNSSEQYTKNFNELELAEKLFLFEYVTILSKGIDPNDLVDRTGKS